MQNAHLRLGLLEYQRATEKISTRIRVRVDRYVGEDRKAHLLSVFGNDSDIGAITAVVHEKATFTLTLPDGHSKEITLGENPSCYKGSISLADRKHPVRHLVAVSQELHANGGVGRTILLRYQRDEAWATLVSFLGLPGEPTWADYVLGTVEDEDRIKELDGIGCRPVLISATTEEILEWIGDGLRSQTLIFPEKNGPIAWPRYSLGDLWRFNGKPAGAIGADRGRGQLFSDSCCSRCIRRVNSQQIPLGCSNQQHNRVDRAFG